MANQAVMDLDGKAPPTLADIRKLQRIGKKLDKRFISARDSINLATREAVNYANACGWSKPSPGDNEAMVAVWARKWMSAYNRQFDLTLSAAIREQTCTEAD